MKAPRGSYGNACQFIKIGGVVLMSFCCVYSIVLQIGIKAKSSLYDISSSNQEDATTTTTISSSVVHYNTLGIPQGQAIALPSIRLSENENKAIKRRNYGGEGDKPHLGGFTTYDGQGVSVAVWNHMISNLGVKSIMDVGCGRGISSLYFLLQGVDTLCIEGSHDAVEHTLLPDPKTQIVEHDFSRGPYWPAKTYDAVWSVEFLEHVGRNYQYNYIQAFRKAAFLFVTHSRWGGWHHVEVHDMDWWINRMESFGFRYSRSLTEAIRRIAADEKNKNKKDDQERLGPDGEPYNAQHIWLNMIVFINPAVASLPEHAHLMAEIGCHDKDRETGENLHRECDETLGESELPEDFKPLQVSRGIHQIWKDRVKAGITAA